ncbi:MFS transporter [Glycomyces harbinensis]|uniref:MFS transporter n=1 Tax=Glycomyces harbinensis TaxID=58114 RepID=UPI001C40BACB
MRRYAHVLRHADFRRLWIGSTVSILGDGMTFTALSWLVLSGPGGASQLGLLGVCYMAPVLLGGLAVGPLLDRFDKRTVLIADSYSGPRPWRPYRSPPLPGAYPNGFRSPWPPSTGC